MNLTPEDREAKERERIELLNRVDQLDELLAEEEVADDEDDAETEERLYAEIRQAKAAPVRPLPPLELSLAPSAIGISQIALERVGLRLENAPDSPEQPPKLGLRSGVEWVEGGIAVTLDARGEHTRHGKTVICELAFRLFAAQPVDVDDRLMLHFAKSAGLRALLPFLRAEMARLTAMTEVGQLLMAPLIISLEEEWEKKERELYHSLRQPPQ